MCTQAHIDDLKGRLRAGDIEEIEASTRNSPAFMLQRGFDYSPLCWAAVRNDRVICIFGVAAVTTLSTVGTPWLLGSDDLDLCDLELGKATCYYVGEMSRIYPRLENFIYVKQKKAIRWLKWAGFTVDKPAQWGEFGKLFRRFHKE